MNQFRPESHKHFKIHWLTFLTVLILIAVGYYLANQHINIYQQAIKGVESGQIKPNLLNLSQFSLMQLKLIWGSVITILALGTGAMVQYIFTLRHALDEYQTNQKPGSPADSLPDSAPQPEQILQLILDHMDAVVFLSNKEGRYLFLNRKGRNLLGYSENDISGNCHKDWLNTEYVSQWNTPNQPIEGYSQEKQIVHSHHVTTTFKVLTHCFLHPVLQQPVLAGLAIDLSDYKAAEQSLIQKNTELERSIIEAKQANLAKSGLLADLSHELRTPLNAMLGYLQLFEREKSTSETQKISMQAIHSGGEKLLAVINDMADLAKLETQHLELVPEPCQLLDLFDELNQRFRQQATDHQIQFHFRKNQLPTLVEMDRQRFRQICINLFENALQYTEQGEIDLDVQYQPGQLTLQLTDTRAQVSEANSDTLTDSTHSYQLSENRSLSLLVTEALIKKMRGKIQIENKPSAGQCCRFLIPIKTLESAYPSNDEGFDSLNIKGYQRTDGKPGALRILVVDDQRLDRQLLKNMLTSLGFSITEAADGAEAVALTAEQHFDLIFMDMMMPKINGLLATKTILSRSDTDNRCIVALTACAYEQDYINTMAAGCCAYLTKPYKIKALLQVVQEQLPLEWES